MRRLIVGSVLMFLAFSAAMAGSREDQIMLGTLFPPCRDSSADYVKVVALFRADAERGDSRAQFNLGNAYFFGNGVPKDDVEAAKWYRLAARQGEAGAQQNLGYMYEHGRGVPRDDLQAYVLISLALSSGDAVADINAEAAAKSLEILAERLARWWLPGGR